MHFLLAGGYDTQNLGDYASFAALKSLFAQQDVKAKFSVLTRHPDDQFGREFDVEVLMNLDHASKAASLGRVFNGFNEGDETAHVRRIGETLGRADALLLGNGRLFIDLCLDFMRGPLNYFFQLVCLAKYLGKPVILYSVTLVEPDTEDGKTLLGFILRNSDKIIVREHSSLKVAERYVATRDKLVCLPDIAFALDRGDADAHGLPDGVPEGALGVGFRGVNYASEAGADAFAGMVESVRGLLDTYDRPVVFCQQQTYDVDSSVTDDRAVHRRIVQALPHAYRQRCVVYEQKISLANTLALYQKICHLFTMRRHGFILALTQGVPATLLCEEVNTRVVEETVPLAELFVGLGQPLNLPAAAVTAKLPALVAAVRERLTAYPGEILNTVRLGG